MSNVDGSFKREGRKKREIRGEAENFMNVISIVNGSGNEHTHRLKQRETIEIFTRKIKPALRDTT